jgi:hypothetical protein
VRQAYAGILSSKCRRVHRDDEYDIRMNQNIPQGSYCKVGKSMRGAEDRCNKWQSKFALVLVNACYNIATLPRWKKCMCALAKAALKLPNHLNLSDLDGQSHK